MENICVAGIIQHCREDLESRGGVMELVRISPVAYRLWERQLGYEPVEFDGFPIHIEDRLEDWEIHLLDDTPDDTETI